MTETAKEKIIRKANVIIDDFVDQDCKPDTEHFDFNKALYNFAKDVIEFVEQQEKTLDIAIEALKAKGDVK